jgi:hypothetical protein
MAATAAATFGSIFTVTENQYPPGGLHRSSSPGLG